MSQNMDPPATLPISLQHLCLVHSCPVISQIPPFHAIYTILCNLYNFAHFISVASVDFSVCGFWYLCRVPEPNSRGYGGLTVIYITATKICCLKVNVWGAGNPKWQHWYLLSHAFLFDINTVQLNFKNWVATLHACMCVVWNPEVLMRQLILEWVCDVAALAAVIRCYSWVNKATQIYFHSN